MLASVLFPFLWFFSTDVVQKPSLTKYSVERIGYPVVRFGLHNLKMRTCRKIAGLDLR